MRWWHRNKRDPDAMQAKQAAEADLEVIRARWPEVRERTASLRERERRNHLAELFADALRGL